MEPLSYTGALDALRRALVFGINPSLEGIRALAADLGEPQAAFASIQVAGTNGKTSTARIAHALLLAHGRRAGLYTSPELERVNERIEIGAGPVSDERFAAAVGAALAAAERLRPGAQGTAAGFTEFELVTAAALWLFREEGVELAVLEAGLGGRWDATSVASPSVAVITGVGLDHMAVLGDAVEKIAAEKAAIIVPASAPVLGPGTQETAAIFLARAEAADTHARAVRAEGDPTPVPEELTVRYRVRERPSAPGGSTTLDVTGVHAAYRDLRVSAPVHQAANVATAIAAAEAALGRALDETAVRAAVAQLTLPGRFELVRRTPPVVVDGSHNPQAAAVLAGAIADAWPDSACRPALVLGVLADKDAAGIVEALVPVVAGFVATEPDSPRALPAADLGAIVARITGRDPHIAASLADAVLGAAGRFGQGTVVAGSLTTAGQARRLLRDDSATARAGEGGHDAF